MTRTVDVAGSVSTPSGGLPAGARSRRMPPTRRSARGKRQAPHLTSIVFLLPKLVCDALDRASPDAERLGNLQDTHALRKLLSHLAFGHAVYLRPAELHALSNGALEAGFDSLANHCALEFSKGASYLENELAHGGRRDDGLLVQVQVHAACFEMLDRVE